ncbi:MAG: iron-containing alcohol dehydrogenase [Ruminococcus sp.]|nr:iron-containing alcohol dehydrogenase [Ruminococcus sp.]
MDSFNYYSPTEFVFGDGRESEVGALAKKYGAKKVLVHYGSGSAVKSGLIDKVTRSLEEAGLDYTLLGGAQPNPRDTLVYKGIELCKKEGADLILAVGGGSVIDSSKAIAAGVCYGGDFWDFYCGKAPIEKALPVGTVLTIAASGSEGSSSSVITKENGMVKRGTHSDFIRPKFSVLDPRLTFTLPAYQTACGATDIMAHVFERYFTNTKEVEMTDRLCEAVLITMVKQTPIAVAQPDNYGARANIMWAGTIAHNDIVGVGRSQDWNSHGIEHELSGLYDCAHGAGLAVVIPAWMQYVYKHDVMRFCQMATRVFGCQMNFEDPESTALEGISRFRRFLHDIGMPINFEQLGAREQDIPTLAANMAEKYTTRGFVKLTRDDVRNILTIAAHANI